MLELAVFREIELQSVLLCRVWVQRELSAVYVLGSLQR